MIDTLSVAVSDLRVRQLDALRREIPDAFALHDSRMSLAMTSGLAIVNELVDGQPYLQGLMTRLMVLAEENPQFAFLQMIPDGPVLSMMRANALEKALFGVETREVAELALMIGLFTIMLDGLLDEAPEHLRPIKRLAGSA